jgi:serine/threonine-protein kinase
MDPVDLRAVLEPTLRCPPAWDSAAPAAGAGASVSAEPLEARFIGHFAVLRKLGEGGMGVVYAAYDERLERRVALKLIHGDDPVRLMREAQALARVSHPNVGPDLRGRDLRRPRVRGDGVRRGSVAHRSGWPSRGTAERSSTSSCRRAAASRPAHARGLVHRDFKPGNVIVGADGRARVLDFGLARADDRRDEAVPRTSRPRARATPTCSASPLTRTGSLLGTPAYMSPEQFLGVAVDARSDQFSFCVALYEALYDRRPFAGATMPELMAAVTHGRGGAAPAAPGARRDDPRRVLARSGRRSRGSLADDDRAARSPRRRARSGRRAQPARPAGASRGSSRSPASACSVAVNALMGPGDLTPASMTRFALLIALVAVAALPVLRARYREPLQRMYVNFGVSMPAMSVVARFFAWRGGLSMQDLLVAESLCFVTAYMTMAVFLRAPLVLSNIPVLLGALVLVFEFGAPEQLLTLSWLLSVPVTALAWWYTAASRPRRRGTTANCSMSAGQAMPFVASMGR